MPVSGYLYAIGAAITWGVVYTIDQRVLKGISPFSLLFIDAAITAIMLLPALLFGKGVLTVLFEASGRTWIFIVASLVLAALANLLIFSSIKILGASTASIFEIAYPFFVVLFSCFAFRITPTWYFLLGAMLIFSGASIILLFG